MKLHLLSNYLYLRTMSERNEVLNLGNDSLSVYTIQSYFRGRMIRQDAELDELIEAFLSQFTSCMIHQGWSYKEKCLRKHVCTSNCTFETFIVMGRPYSESVRKAVTW